MKIVIDDRGVVCTNPEQPNTLTVNAPVILQGNITSPTVTTTTASISNLTASNVLFNGIVNFPQNIEIYVNTTGSDANPGTATAPIKTFAQALRLTKGQWRGYQRIYMASGSYVEANQIEYYIPAMFGLSGSSANNIASPLEIIGETSILMSGTFDQLTSSANNTRIYFTDTTKANYTDLGSYDGAILDITSGAGIGKYQIIEFNSTGSFGVQVIGAPSGISGSTYRVLKPSARIILSGAANRFVGPGSLKLRSIGIESPGYVTYENIYLDAHMAEFDALANFFVNANINTLLSQTTVDIDTITGPILFFGNNNSSARSTNFYNCQLYFNYSRMHILAKNTSFICQDKTAGIRIMMFFNSLNVASKVLTVKGNSSMEFISLIASGSSAALPLITLGISGSSLSPTPPGHIIGNSLFSGTYSEIFQVKNVGAGNAISINDGSVVRFTTYGSITSTGGRAVEVRSGGQFRAYGARLNLSGSGGDITVGSTTYTSASFVSSGSILDSATLSFATIS